MKVTAIVHDELEKVVASWASKRRKSLLSWHPQRLLPWYRQKILSNQYLWLIVLLHKAWLDWEDFILLRSFLSEVKIRINLKDNKRGWGRGVLEKNAAERLFYCQAFREDSNPDFCMGLADEFSIAQADFDEGFMIRMYPRAQAAIIGPLWSTRLFESIESTFMTMSFPLKASPTTRHCLSLLSIAKRLSIAS